MYAFDYHKLSTDHARQEHFIPIDAFYNLQETQSRLVRQDSCQAHAISTTHMNMAITFLVSFVAI
jgi:hypothetical protein